MPFDPDAYLAEKTAQAPSAPAFDPDAYLTAKGPAIAAQTPLAASAAAGAIGSIPGAKQLGAAGKTALDVLTGATDPGDAVEEYRNERDRLSEDLSSKTAAHPGAALAGGFAGMAALPIGSSAPAMAAYGGASALGDSSADLTQGGVGKAAVDTAKGAALGGVIGAASNAAAPYIEKGVSSISGQLGDYLNGLANRRAIAATGATGREALKFAPDAGNQLLDRGMMGFGTSQSQIAKNVQGGLNQAGQKIGDTLGSLDAQGVQVDRNTVLKYIQDKIDALSGDESQKLLVNQLKQKVSDISEQIPDVATDYLSQDSSEDAPPSSIPISQAEKIKRGFDDAGKWNSNSDAASLEASRIAGNAYRSASEDAANKAVPDLGDDFTQAKQDYALLKPIADAASKRASTVAQSPTGGLLDTSATAVGAIAGGAPGAVIAPFIRKQISSRAMSAEAVGANFLSNVVQRAPETLGKYARVLQKAAVRGGSALGATDYILQQTDPAYRQKIQSLKNDTKQVVDDQGS